MTRAVRFEGKYLRFVTEDRWEFAERTHGPNVVLVIAVTPDAKLILVEQYRYAVKSRIIELPAGLVGDIDPDEEIADSAMRELEEETGYRPARVQFIAKTPLCPGAVDEIAHFYRALDLEKVGAGGGVDDENIIVHEAPLSGIDEWLTAKEKEGFMVDSKIYAGLHFLARKA